MATSNAASSSAREFAIYSVFEASREELFAAFATLETLKNRWGLKGFQRVTAKLDLRPGGMGGIPPGPWMPEGPLEVLNTVRFTEQAGRTTIPLRGTPINASEAAQKLFASGRESMEKGFAGTFAQLDEFLASGQAGRAS